MAGRWRTLFTLGRGADRGVPPAALSGRLLRARNARIVPPGTNRVGLGKRAGLAKVFTNSVGQASPGPDTMRATGALRCIRASNVSVNLDGNYINVVDDFRNYATPSLYGGTFYSGVDLAGNYITFAKDPTAAYAVFNPTTGYYPNCPAVPYYSVDPRTTGRGLRLSTYPLDASLNYGVLINYRAPQRIKYKLKIEASPYGTQGADYPTPNADGFTNLAIVVRGSPNLSSFVCVYVQATSTDQVRLVLETHNAGTTVTYAGTNTLTISRRPGPSYLTLEVTPTSSSVSARFVWGDQGIDETQNWSQAPVGTFNAAEDRAGLMLRHAGTGIYRDIVELEYTILRPLPRRVLYSFLATDNDPTGGRWQIPKGWDSVYLTTGTVSGYDGSAAGYSENGSTPTVNYPMIDRVGSSPASGASAEPQVYGGRTNGTTGEGGANNGGAQQDYSRFVMPSDYADDAVYGAGGTATETAWIQLFFNNNDGTIDDSVGAVVRVDGIVGTY